MTPIDKIRETKTGGPKPRVLVLSATYPSPGFRIRGLWVERLVRATASFAAPVVISPVPWVPPGLLPDQRERNRRTPRERWDGSIPVYGPRTAQTPIHRLLSLSALLAYPFVRRLADRLHRRQPFALVHAHFIYPDGVVAARLGRRYGIPVLTTEHANWLPWLAAQRTIRWQVLAALKDIRLVTGVSHSTADSVRAVAGDRVAVEVLPNALDEEIFAPAAGDPAADAAAGDPNRLLFVGLVRRVKGLDVLLHALLIVMDRRPSLYLEVVGETFVPGHQRDEAAIRKLVGELGLGGRVRFVGGHTPPEVARKMRQSAVLVLPSRRESFGSVLIEALACGTPVVATRCGGPEDFMDDSLGRLVPPEDPEALAEALLDVHDRRAEFDPWRLHTHVVERYGREATERRLRDLYSRVLTAPAPLPRVR